MKNKNIKLTNMVKKVGASSLAGLILASVLCVNVFAGTTSANTIPVSSTNIISAGVVSVTNESEKIHINESGEEFLNTPKYTFTRVKKTKYIKSAVTVLNLPCSSGKKIGKLSKAQAVTVTGKCNETGWYRIKYKGKTGYVSNKYIVNKKPTTKSQQKNNTSETVNISIPHFDISNVPEEKIQQIKSLIIWETEYSKETEDAVIYELNKLPDKIFNAYLNVASNNIIIKPFIDQYSNGITLGRIQWSVCNGVVTQADIYMLNDMCAVKQTILHEIGHYVRVAYGCAGYNNSLPYYASDAVRFSTTEYGYNYYASSESEYFAELFKYTIDNGTTDKYSDTYSIQHIIDNFVAL